MTMTMTMERVKRTMTMDLVLKLSCIGCGSSSDLYGSGCKHLTLCLSCGRSMTQQKAKCSHCGAVLTRLIREYDVVRANNDDKNYFIGRFSTGLPNFSKNKSLCKNKDKPWVLEDETGRSETRAIFKNCFQLNYYLLMQEGEEISVVPAGSWFNFDKVAQYNKQLTLEEAEAKMINKKKMQDLYQRRLMKAATNGAVAFGKVNKFGGKDSKQKTCFNDDDDDEGNISDNDDEEQEGARKNRLGLKRRGGDDEGNISDNSDEEEDVARKNILELERTGGDDEGTSGDDDFDNDDSEKDDDWKLEEIFSDDDENNTKETEDFATEDDEEDDNNEEEGALSESGKELKKLLGHLAESDTQDDDETEDINIIENSHYGLAQTTPSTSKPSKGMRKRYDDDAEAFSCAPPQKLKTENNQDKKPSIKEEPAFASPISEEEIRAVLEKEQAISLQDLVDHYPGRVESNEEKKALIAGLRSMSYKILYIRDPKTMKPVAILY